MANEVNPPPQLRIPKAIFEDKELLAYEKQRDTILFQLWRKLGGNNDPLAEINNISTNGYSSQVQFLQQQLNGLPEFTMDTEGFTMDSTEFTMDKVIA